ncbi:MAG: serine/threonine-protein kinase, partial [Polyangiales bacterium]
MTTSEESAGGSVVARSALGAGDRVGRYRIEGEVGAGGMGRVYRAFDETLHRRVALKVLLAPMELDVDARREAVARLIREARAAAALHHENVVSVFDVGEHEGLPFIAIELVDGLPLRALIATASVEQKLAWLLQVARALEAAHDAGIVHRDIKPENVIVRAKDRVAKVLDFGIAKSAASFATNATADAALATVTAQGAIIGTPTYMAPEQLRGEALDGRCDQFAWGVMAYELLAQKLPWDAKDGLGIVAQVLSREAEPLRADEGPLTEAVARTVARALSKARDDRFASMAALMEALGPIATLSGSGSARVQVAAASAEISTARTERAESAQT